MNEPKSGVYRHYKLGPDGKPRFYQLLFVADFWGREAVEADTTLAVVIDYDGPLQDDDGVPVLRIEDATDDPTVTTIPLLMARAHGRIEPHTDCAVYVPLNADKPGRRISVRPLVEWVVPRFAYVGDSIPEEMLK